jgi:hypothetical protein
MFQLEFENDKAKEMDIANYHEKPIGRKVLSEDEHLSVCSNEAKGKVIVEFEAINTKTI